MRAAGATRKDPPIGDGGHPAESRETVAALNLHTVNASSTAHSRLRSRLRPTIGSTHFRRRPVALQTGFCPERLLAVSRGDRLLR